MNESKLAEYEARLAANRQEIASANQQIDNMRGDFLYLCETLEYALRTNATQQKYMEEIAFETSRALASLRRGTELAQQLRARTPTELHPSMQEFIDAE